MCRVYYIYIYVYANLCLRVHIYSSHIWASDEERHAIIIIRGPCESCISSRGICKALYYECAGCTIPWPLFSRCDYTEKKWRSRTRKLFTRARFHLLRDVCHTVSVTFASSRRPSSLLSTLSSSSFVMTVWTAASTVFGGHRLKYLRRIKTRTTCPSPSSTFKRTSSRFMFGRVKVELYCGALTQKYPPLQIHYQSRIHKTTLFMCTFLSLARLCTCTCMCPSHCHCHDARCSSLLLSIL